MLLALLLTVAVWFRVTSLESMPDIESDEAWYGVQAYHLGRGQPFEFRTPTGNPLNPLHTGLEVPLLLLFKPSFWILRAPAVLSGTLAIALCYVLGARVFGRRTALIAAVLVAVLPITLTLSRKGYDCSPLPLMSFLLFYFTYKDQWKGMLLAAAGCFLSHPTSIFLFPIVATVFLVRAVLRNANDPAKLQRLAAATMVCGLAVLLCGLLILTRPRMREIFYFIKFGGLARGFVLDGAGSIGSGPLAEFVTRYGKLCLSCSSFGLWPGPVHDWAFWSVFLPVLVLGTIQLVRFRQWDRLALVGGLFLGGAVFFLTVGPEVLRPDTNRYGYFLIIPTILGFAFLLERLVITPSTPLRRALLYVQCAVFLAVGGLLLADFKVRCFDASRGSSREERVWTIRTDARDAKSRAMRLIETDRELAAVHRARGERMGLVYAQGQNPGKGKGTGSGSPTIVFVQDWWTCWTLRYCALPYPDVEVRSLYETYDGDQNKFWADFRAAKEAGGAYVVCFKGQELEGFLRENLPTAQLRSWEVVRYGNAPTPMTFSRSVMIYRDTLPTDPPAAAVATKTDAARVRK